jgi:hypothetical protein
MYSEFEKLNCSDMEQMNQLINKENASAFMKYLDFPDQDSHCKKLYDVNTSSKLIMKQFEVNGSCTEFENSNNAEPVYGCVGYNCLPGNIYQKTDDFNTFHNYLVLQDTEPPSACTENHQVYHNWTRRKLPNIPPERRDITFTGQFGQRIPTLKFNTCTFKKEVHDC